MLFVSIARLRAAPKAMRMQFGGACVVANVSLVTTPSPRFCNCAAKRALGHRLR